MNAYKAYQKTAPVQTRIDTTLSLYEAVIERLEKSLKALGRQDEQAAKKQLAAATLGVAALASAIDGRSGELASNLLQLYNFIGHCLRFADSTKLQAALNVLRTLHEGFDAIRPQAVQMERTGVIPPLPTASTFQASA